MQTAYRVGHLRRQSSRGSAAVGGARRAPAAPSPAALALAVPSPPAAPGNGSLCQRSR